MADGPHGHPTVGPIAEPLLVGARAPAEVAKRLVRGSSLHRPPRSDAVAASSACASRRRPCVKRRTGCRPRPLALMGRSAVGPQALLLLPVAIVGLHAGFVQS
jgi:hypothetical protein